jgi:hypothetical protein
MYRNRKRKYVRMKDDSNKMDRSTKIKYVRMKDSSNVNVQVDVQIENM